MSQGLSIRPATPADEAAIRGLLREAPANLRAQAYDLGECLASGRGMLAEQSSQAVAFSALNLEWASLQGVMVARSSRGQGLGRGLVVAGERLAIQFGITSLGVYARPATRGFFEACGYHRASPAPDRPAPPRGSTFLERRFARRQTRYGRRIADLLVELGIPGDYGRRHLLTLQAECTELQSIGRDIHGREQFMAPASARAWRDMRTAAMQDGIPLEVVSAWRSVDYQAGIIRRKTGQGQGMDQVLAVSAAPGFSEHHTGRALDIAAPGSPPLEEAFELTSAYQWLREKAGAFGFTLSYPRHNRHGIAYEPWHWCWRQRGP